jgi:hypothetical protein
MQSCCLWQSDVLHRTNHQCMYVHTFSLSSFLIVLVSSSLSSFLPSVIFLLLLTEVPLQFHVTFMLLPVYSYVTSRQFRFSEPTAPFSP